MSNCSQTVSVDFPKVSLKNNKKFNKMMKKKGSIITFFTEKISIEKPVPNHLN